MKSTRVLPLGCALMSCLIALTASAQVLDPIVEVSAAEGLQGWPQATYNPNCDEYLVVWEEYRHADTTGSDIWGQFVRGDGTLRGDNFPICQTVGDQFWPHVAFNKYAGCYLVVFEDYRNATSGTWQWIGNWDVYAALLDMDGRHIPVATSEADSCFAISTNPGAAHYTVVSFNDKQQTFLVAWADYRNGSMDIYGQIVSSEGSPLGPPTPPDPTINFPIITGDANDDVPDVSYCAPTDEWLVVCASGDWENSRVMGQRVSGTGELLRSDGSSGAEPMVISEATRLGTDPVQPRVEFNNEWPAGLAKSGALAGLCQALVIWKTLSNGYADIYGHRVAIISEADAVALGLKDPPAVAGRFFATLMNELGKPGATASENFPISDAPGYKSPAEITYGQQDDEYVIGWGVARDITAPQNHDFYVQRLGMAPDSALIWWNLDRSDIVASSANTPVDTTASYEGGLVAAAHGSHRNEFFFVYTFASTGLMQTAGGRASAKEAGKTARMTDVDLYGTAADLYGRRLAGSPPTGAQHARGALPLQFAVYHNYPNPFNPQTTICFALPAEVVVKLQLFDITGHKVNSLLDERRPAGRYEVVWDGTDGRGAMLPSGVYLYRLTMGASSYAGKMTLLR
ncbi:MAG: FlgD immunoglobulin-like domain containing protein [Candidatus Oleimicrobiaceae bacterium]